jgi:hypothetical protein
MPQETNLNVAPYFDDYSPLSNYYRVLFKPGFPVQARELNSLQSTLQNQIEDVGNHFFKEGSKVIPGDTTYQNNFHNIQIQEEYLGIPVSLYLDQLVGKTITGATSGVTAQVVTYITDEVSEKGNYTLYLNYYNASNTDASTETFSDNEVLLTNDEIVFATTFIAAGEGFALTLPQNASSVGAAFIINQGVYYLRGFFVDVEPQILILDQYSNTPNCRVGLTVIEELISSDNDESLNDNARGFNNYTAPGADRLKISALLDKKGLQEFDVQNFVQLSEVVNGQLRVTAVNPEYNFLGQELARRTYDESGHYYIKEFVTGIRESLNDGIGNRGIYNEGQTTYQGNTPSENALVYKISPGKAYVKGYEVETLAPTLLDSPKPRTTRTISDQAVNFGFGPTFEVNNVTGAPVLGINTSNTLSLRNFRVGGNKFVRPGKEVGLARIYDFALESGSYDTTIPTLNRWDLSLWDIQTYTDISLNESATLDVPIYIKGESSGATGYLRHSVTGTGLTAYNTSGEFFIGENLLFNGVLDNSRYVTDVRSFDISDVKSVFGDVGINTFTADLRQKSSLSFGQASVTGAFSGISTVSVPIDQNQTFIGIVSTGNVVQYSRPSLDIVSYGRVTGVARTNFTIAPVETVAGVCNGALPTSKEDVNNLQLLESTIQRSSGGGNFAENESLYSIFPKQNISEVNLEDSSIVIREQFETSITSNSTPVISAGNNKVFLPFDEERYNLLRSDGTTEVLTADKFEFTNGNRDLQINGLGSNDNDCLLITTIRKSKVTSKTKLKAISENVIINKSKNSASGIGSTTLNDGLQFGDFPFGTRVQDDVISLNQPDIVSIYGIFESTTTEDPKCPSMVCASLDGPTASTNDLIIGETITGTVSGAKATYLVRDNLVTVSFSYQNLTNFQSGEVITFSQSGVNAVATNILAGSTNRTRDFIFNNGQKGSYYDISRIIKKAEATSPASKLRIYYERAFYSESDDGDITSVNSYQLFNYSTEIPTVDGNRTTDLIDARPRVAPYTVTPGARSPFEFEGRNFNLPGNGNLQSSEFILASDESMNVEYSYYLPRIDRIYINPENVISIVFGTPDDNPTLPSEVTGELNIANIYLPAYLFNVEDVEVKFIDHKRYQMSDISKLEQRIKNLEYYTSLNQLEQSTINQFVEDANGLNRFKSGVFVDNFTSLLPQDTSIGVRNSIDIKQGILRPSHYTTALNLEVASTAVTGIGTTTAANQDPRYAQIVGNGIKRSNQVVTLDFAETRWLEQPYATRVESVTPLLIKFWAGNLELQPNVDVWIDVNRLEVRDVLQEGSFLGVAEALQTEVTTAADGSRSGVSPVIWNSWETTGVNVDLTLNNDQASREVTTNRASRETIAGRLIEVGTQVTQTLTSNRLSIGGNTTLNQQRTGTQFIVNEQIDTESLGDRTVRRDVIHTMRTRGIQFTCKTLKPFTQVYAFFDEVDVNSFCLNKLIEIEMTSGTFQVGETVQGRMNNDGVELLAIGTTPSINFRVANSNHKYGPYNDPTDVYNINPYDRNNQVPSTYSETSTTVNVDTFSLSDDAYPDFFGYVAPRMILVGQSSGAQAVVSRVRLIPDNVGTLIGNYSVPNPANPSNPVFDTGRSLFRLTSSPINSTISGTFTTSAEETFYSQGDIDTTQEVTLSLRNARVDTLNREQQRTLTTGNVTSNVVTIESVSNINVDTNIVDVTPPPPPPPPPRRGDPLAQTFSVDDTTGIFVTSCDVFFFEKDDNIPVTMELRTTELGQPTETILAYSTVVKDAADVRTSTDGTVATNFVFESPVFLNPNTEYAVVLQSVTTTYSVWISRMGEADVSTIATEAGQVLVTEQPLLGSLFKSQNASAWTPSQYEDLKFTMYRADFNQAGSLAFVNPDLPSSIAAIPNNGLTLESRTIRVGLGTTVQDSDLEFGNTVFQSNTNQSPTGTLVALAGSATGNMTLTNPGVGYTPAASPPHFTYTGVALTSITGFGINATADITIQNGVAIAATIAAGGVGYKVADVLTPIQVGTEGLGAGMKLSLAEIQGENQLELTDVQGTFGTGANQFIQFVNSSGIQTSLNSTVGEDVRVDIINVIKSGDDVKVFQRNHGMYSDVNRVSITDVSSDIVPTTLSDPFSNTTTTFLSVENVINFTTFENLGIANTNPGYVKIGSEIIAYTAVDGNTLTGITRGVDNTVVASHSQGELVYKYELDGVSLLRINTTHELSDYTGPEPITLDTYNISVNMGSGASKTNRAPGNAEGFPALYFNRDTTGGGIDVKGSYNLPFTQMIPKINTIMPTGTVIYNNIRTISESSVNGTEASYVDQGYQSSALFQTVTFNTPRMVASNINEETLLDGEIYLGSKSLTFTQDLVTGDSRISPAIDLNDMGVIFTNNRINAPVVNYATDPRVNTIEEDPNRFIYVTKNIVLENPATSLQVQLDAYVSNYNDIRVFYALNQDTDAAETIFVPFPGYANIDINGSIIDPANNDGTPDVKVPKMDSFSQTPSLNLFREYKFTVDEQVAFRTFRIKIIGTSTNMAIVPQIKNLRAISFA